MIMQYRLRGRIRIECDEKEMMKILNSNLAIKFIDVYPIRRNNRTKRRIPRAAFFAHCFRPINIA